MHLRDELMQTVVRIEAQSPSRKSVGTGFWYHLSTKSGKGTIYGLVTNKHVVEGADRLHLPVTSHKANGNDVNHEVLTYLLKDALIINHPSRNVDLCAVVVSNIFSHFQAKNSIPFLKMLGEDDLADDEFNNDVLPADQIFMIGYPNGLWDSKNNSAIVRSGVIATSLKNNYEGRSEFLVDVACFPGSSGSPIYVARTGPRETRDGSLVFGGEEFRLVGVLWGGPQYGVEGQIVAKPIPTSSKPVALTGIPNNLGFAIKAKEVKVLSDWAKEHL